MDKLKTVLKLSRHWMGGFWGRKGIEEWKHWPERRKRCCWYYCCCWGWHLVLVLEVGLKLEQERETYSAEPWTRTSGCFCRELMVSNDNTSMGLSDKFLLPFPRPPRDLPLQSPYTHGWYIWRKIKGVQSWPHGYGPLMSGTLFDLREREFTWRAVFGCTVNLCKVKWNIKRE